MAVLIPEASKPESRARQSGPHGGTLRQDACVTPEEYSERETVDSRILAWAGLRSQPMPPEALDTPSATTLNPKPYLYPKT